MAVGLGKTVGEGVWLGAGEAVGGRVAIVGALVAVGGGGSVPQEVSRRGKISHGNMYFFIILNFPVIFAIILRKLKINSSGPAKSVLQTRRRHPRHSKEQPGPPQL